MIVPQDIASLVESFYTRMARRDYAALQELLDPKVEWNSAENFLYAENNPYVGWEKVFSGILRQVDKDWETFEVEPQERLYAGETAIVRGRYRGKLRGLSFSLDAEFVHVLRFRNGRLLSGQSYTDTAQFRDAVAHLRDKQETATQTQA